jgi:hypothetical protein
MLKRVVSALVFIHLKCPVPGTILSRNSCRNHTFQEQFIVTSNESYKLQFRVPPKLLFSDSHRPGPARSVSGSLLMGLHRPRYILVGRPGSLVSSHQNSAPKITRPLFPLASPKISVTWILTALLTEVRFLSGEPKIQICACHSHGKSVTIARESRQRTSGTFFESKGYLLSIRFLG